MNSRVRAKRISACPLRGTRGRFEAADRQSDIAARDRAARGLRRSNAVDDSPEWLKTGAVTGAVPRFFCGVPGDQTAQVRTDGGEFMQGSIVGPVSGCLLQAVTKDRTRSR